MKKRSLIIFTALVLVPLILFAQISGSSPYASFIRSFLSATTTAAARTAIGAVNSGSGGTLTNATIYGSTSGSWTFGSTAGITSSSAATLGVGTSAPDKAVEINSATGSNLRLTYNDSDGSAANYADFSVSSGGNLTINPSGGFIGIGGATATHGLTVPSSSTGIALYNTSDQTSNYERGVLSWAGNNLTISVEKGGSGSARTFNVSTAAGNLYFRGGGSASGIYQLSAVATGTVGIFGYNFSGSGSSATSGSNTALSLTPTYNQASGTAANTDLLINRTETAIGSGTQLLIDAQVGSVSKFKVSNSGSVTTSGYIASGVQSLSGAGAVNVTTGITEVTSTGAAQALTLADGVAGQEKTIIHGVDGGSAILTPTTKTGFSTVTFTTAGESVTLVFLTTRGWIVKSSYLATIAP